MELLYQSSNNKNLYQYEEELCNIYIIDERGGVIFPNHDLFKDFDETEQQGFSNLMKAMESLAKDMGNQELNSIQLGKDRYYSKIDEITNINFIYKTNKNKKERLVVSTLDKIKNSFLNHFTGKFTASEEEQRYLMLNFLESLVEIFDEENKVKNFLKVL